MFLYYALSRNLKLPETLKRAVLTILMDDRLRAAAADPHHRRGLSTRSPTPFTNKKKEARLQDSVMEALNSPLEYRRSDVL